MMMAANGLLSPTLKRLVSRSSGKGSRSGGVRKIESLHETSSSFLKRVELLSTKK